MIGLILQFIITLKLVTALFCTHLCYFLYWPIVFNNKMLVRRKTNISKIRRRKNIYYHRNNLSRKRCFSSGYAEKTWTYKNNLAKHFKYYFESKWVLFNSRLNLVKSSYHFTLFDEYRSGSRSIKSPNWFQPIF